MLVEARFPNESFYDTLTIDLTEVKVKSVFKDEVFIVEGGVHLAMKRKYYDEMLNQNLLNEQATGKVCGESLQG